MDHRNVIDHDGITVHEAMFNSHTGFLIDIACGLTAIWKGRYKVVHPYKKFDPARLTDKPLSCPTCVAVCTPGPEAAVHAGTLARTYADAVLARADNRGYPPSMDDEGLRLALLGLSFDIPPVEKIYPLVREHLADVMTERALTVPAGTPQVLVRYERYTGGTVRVPVGVGDRLMHDGVAGGDFSRHRVTAVEKTLSGVVVTLMEEDFQYSQPCVWSAPKLARRFSKVERAWTA